jgi:hypothetical protein
MDLDPYLLPMTLCAGARLNGENLIGDPTVGALIVLGSKGGLDMTAIASVAIAKRPRLETRRANQVLGFHPNGGMTAYLREETIARTSVY